MGDNGGLEGKRKELSLKQSSIPIIAMEKPERFYLWYLLSLIRRHPNQIKTGNYLLVGIAFTLALVIPIGDFGVLPILIVIGSFPYISIYFRERYLGYRTLSGYVRFFELDVDELLTALRRSFDEDGIPHEELDLTYPEKLLRLLKGPENEQKRKKVMGRIMWISDSPVEISIWGNGLYALGTQGTFIHVSLTNKRNERPTWDIIKMIDMALRSV